MGFIFYWFFKENPCLNSRFFFEFSRENGDKKRSLASQHLEPRFLCFSSRKYDPKTGFCYHKFFFEVGGTSLISLFITMHDYESDKKFPCSNWMVLPILKKQHLLRMFFLSSLFFFFMVIKHYLPEWTAAWW